MTGNRNGGVGYAGNGKLRWSKGTPPIVAHTFKEVVRGAQVFNTVYSEKLIFETSGYTGGAIMNEKIFGSVESTLQTLAKVFFWLGEIGAVIWSIVFGFQFDRYGDGNFNFFQFLLMLVVSGVSVFIFSLLLHAIGEALENLKHLKHIRENSNVVTIAFLKEHLELKDTQWVCPNCYKIVEEILDSRYNSNTYYCPHCRTLFPINARLKSNNQPSRDMGKL